MTATATSVAVRYEPAAGGIGRIVLDAPPLNILTLAALGDLEAAIIAANSDPALKVCCLQGEGRAFCAGVSVADHAAELAPATIGAFGRCIRLLLSFDAPVIAAVHGATLGGGCELALACDFVLARDDLKMGQPEIALGVFPPAAAALLPPLVGRQLALDLILTGRSLAADEALRHGLVSRVFGAASFAAERDRVLQRLASLSGPALRVAKHAVHEAGGSMIDGGLARAEATYLFELLRLDDAHEGIAAFIEKREPVWGTA